MDAATGPTPTLLDSIADQLKNVLGFIATDASPARDGAMT
jgi:hypothetical protein